jgi:hypothetical protein
LLQLSCPAAPIRHFLQRDRVMLITICRLYDSPQAE